MGKLEAKLFSKKPSIYTTFAKSIRDIRSQLRRFIDNELTLEKRSTSMARPLGAIPYFSTVDSITG